MSFDNTAETAPDLSKPSLEGLAWLLRHKERWPTSFQWNFSEANSCGIGLARREWSSYQSMMQSFAQHHPPFGLTLPQTVAIFYRGAGLNLLCWLRAKWRVTPEMVAERIEQHLE